MPGFL